MLNAVLAESQYHPSWFDRWVQRVWYDVAQVLERAAQAIAGVLSHVPVGVAKVLGWILIGILVLGVAALLAYLVHSIVRIYSYESPHTSEARKPRTTAPKRPTVEELLAEAEAEASQGHFREALRRTYLASLLSLDRRGVITYTDSGTNWEYMSSLARKTSAEKAGVFRVLTKLFDESVYGHTEIAEIQYADGKRAFHALEELA
jgi:thioesterase domain-containing protein